jgi:hypothetical protein
LFFENFGRVLEKIAYFCTQEWNIESWDTWLTKLFITISRKSITLEDGISVQIYQIPVKLDVDETRLLVPLIEKYVKKLEDEDLQLAEIESLKLSELRAKLLEIEKMPDGKTELEPLLMTEKKFIAQKHIADYMLDKPADPAKDTRKFSYSLLNAEGKNVNFAVLTYLQK